MPPYSNKVSDYTSQPNKVSGILNVTGLDVPITSVYVEGSISSFNDDIQIYTKPGHKPLQPITFKRLPSGPYMPYMLTYNDIRNIFDDHWLVYKGITRQQALKDGLPEGIYRICFKVFDYSTNAPLSIETCSNTFSVSAVEAPIIIQPQNQSEIAFMPVQSLVFFWLTPPGAPINTQYKLRIIELSKNGPNPVDALRSTGYPVFFETTVTGNTYLYSAANPKLTEGKNYAFLVTAIDPMGNTLFRNKGASEIYTFTYNGQQNPMNGPTPNPPTPNPPPPPPQSPPANMAPTSATIPQPLSTTTISGVLKYKYPDGATVSPIKNATIRLVVKYIVKNADNTDKEILNSDINFSSLAFYITGPKLNEIIANTTTDAIGKFKFSFTGNYTMGLMDDHYQCGSQVAKLKEANLDEVDQYLAYNFNDKTNLSDSYGNLKDYKDYASIKSSLKMIGYLSNNCKLYRYFCIEIDAPHNNFYLNPDKEDKNRLAPQPGSAVDMGDVIAQVRTFNLSVKVQDASAGTSMSPLSINTDPNNPGIDGVNVYILRKYNISVSGSIPIFPNDGVIPNESNSHKPDVAMQVVGKTTTGINPKGLAVFKDLVFHNHANYQYYVYVDVDRTGMYNFKMGSPVWIDLYTLMDPAHGQSSGSGSNLVVDADANKYQNALAEHSATSWISPVLSQTLKLEPQFPSVKVSLTNEMNEKIKDPGTKVLLTETYHIKAFDLVDDPYGFKSYTSATTFNRAYYLANTDSGFFEINDLPIVITQNNVISGPSRQIMITSPGYKDTALNIADKLKMGEQKYVSLKLTPGSVITGKIVDLDTQIPIGTGATVKNLGSQANIAIHCNPDGTYSIMAKRLPNKMQYFEFSAPGYISDTMHMLVKNDKHNLPPRNLHKKVRKLEVWVKDLDTNQPLKGMKVTLPEVSSTLVNFSTEANLNFSAGNAAINAGNTNNNIHSNNAATLISNASLNTNNTATIHANTNISNSNNTQTLANNNHNQVSINNISTNLGSAPNNNSGTNQIPLSVYTNNEGYAKLSFTSGEDNNTEFTVVISNPESNAGNYAAKTFTVKLPYGQSDYEFVMLSKAGCVKGTVYGGTSTQNPVSGATIRFTEDDGFLDGKADYLNTQANSDGSYTLRNVPLYGSNLSMPRTIEAMKTGIIGDHASILIKVSNTCIAQDFHLKVYDNMDLSSLLGFEMKVSTLLDNNNKVIVSGTLSAPKNDQFTATQDIPFSNIEIVKSSQVNNSNVPFAEPAGGTAKTDVNILQLCIFNTFNGTLCDSLGIRLIKTDNSKPFGGINGKVKINKNNFGGTGYDLPDLMYLASSATGNSRTIIKAFSSGTDSKNPNALTGAGFYICTKTGLPITYTINGFPNGATTKPEKSFFNQNGLILNTSIKANITNIQPSNLNIDLGDVKINNSGINFTANQPLEIGLGQWTLKCNNWGIGSEGLTIAQAVLSTGVDIQCENFKLTSSQLQTDKAIVHLEKVKLLGLHDLFITTNFKGLNYVYTWGGVYAWQVFATPDQGQSKVGYVQGLPAMSPSEKLEFSSVSINSEGESELVLISKPIKLYNLVDFIPAPASILSLYKDFFKMRGNYQFGIPYAESLLGSVAYYNNNNQLAFRMDNMDPIFFTHHNVQYKMNAVSLTDNLFIAKGTLEELGNVPQLNVTLSETPQLTKIGIDLGQKIKMNESKYLGDVKGGISVINHQWETLRFDGLPVGLGSISQNNQRYAFVVNGAVTATGQTISVSEIPSFPGMTLTYDMANSRFIGSCDLNMNLGGLKLTGNVNTIMDGSGWLFQASGSMEIPGLGGANVFGLFGDYTGIPSEVSSKFGSAVCLPADFNHNLHGFFLSAGITKQILPNISQNYGIVSVEAGVDLSVNARTFMKFGQGGTVFGLGVLAEGHAYASGSCDITCTEASADASLQVGISGDYNASSHNFNIDGCASASLKFSVEQCIPVVIGCGPCASISLPSLTLGASMHLDNNNGFSMGITTSSCDQQCH